MAKDQELANANFKSRIFGIFNEEIVRLWFRNPRCRNYEDLGRPTLYDLNGTRIATLDFTIRNKKTYKIYIVEQKCFYGYRKGLLANMSASEVFIKEFESWSNWKENQTKAWRCFINFNGNYYVKVGKEKKIIDGRILIWSKYEKAGKKMLMEKLKIQDILSIEEIVRDLIIWKDKNYLDFIHKKKEIIKELFNSLEH